MCHKKKTIVEVVEGSQRKNIGKGIMLNILEGSSLYWSEIHFPFNSHSLILALFFGAT